MLYSMASFLLYFSSKFGYIHRQKPALESHVFSGEYCKIFKSTYFEVDLRTAASVIFQNHFPENLKTVALDFTIFQFCLFHFDIFLYF